MVCRFYDSWNYALLDFWLCLFFFVPNYIYFFATNIYSFYIFASFFLKSFVLFDEVVELAQSLMDIVL